MGIESQIKQKALEIGFDCAGITTAEPVEASEQTYFQQWLNEGRAAKMTYLHRNIDKRFDPGKLLDEAKSVICVGLNYRLKQDEEILNPPVRIARFAQYEDYHPFIKERLFTLADFIQGLCHDEHIHFKACTDSAPVAERALARRAGLGFIGKNHMLIHPELGSQILLGELITTLALEPDEPMANQSCGDCGKCIRACPTRALDFDGTFDARKCISYLTIEAPDPSVVIPASEPGSSATPSGCRIKSGMTNDIGNMEDVPNYVFGCDECIMACPHEMNKPSRKNSEFQHHPEWQSLTCEQIHDMTEESFQTIFSNSGFVRLGLDRLKRNCKRLGSNL